MTLVVPNLAVRTMYVCAYVRTTQSVYKERLLANQLFHLSWVGDVRIALQILRGHAAGAGAACAAAAARRTRRRSLLPSDVHGSLGGEYRNVANVN